MLSWAVGNWVALCFAHVASRRGVAGGMVVAAEVFGGWYRLSRVCGKPLGPVRPPRAVMSLRGGQPGAGVPAAGGSGVIGGPRLAGRINDGLDVSGRGDHDLAASAEQLAGEVAGFPRRDVVGLA